MHASLVWDAKNRGNNKREGIIDKEQVWKEGEKKDNGKNDR